MKKLKVVLGVVLALVIAFSFAGCDTPSTKSIKNAKLLGKVSDVYAFSVMSTAELMSAMPQGGSAVKNALLAEGADAVANDDILQKQIDDVNTYLTMFEGMLTGKDPIDTTVKADVTYKEVLYTSYMEIAVKKIDGTSNVYKFYFNETKLTSTPENEDNAENDKDVAEKTLKAIDTVADKPVISEEDKIDETEREQEIETKLSGIMVVNDVEYVVDGKKEIETETEGEEVEKEFTITFTATDANNNKIKVVQTIEEEEGEKEQKFSFEMRDKDNKIVSKSVLSMEVEADEVEITLSLEENGVKTNYKFDREEDKIKIHYTNADGKKVVCKVTIIENTDGTSSYEYKFADGKQEKHDRD